MRILLCIVVVAVFAAACRPYTFVRQGHFIDGVDEYFNFSRGANIWVYMDYLPFDGTTGVRLDSLYPQDRMIFDHIGLNGRKTKVLFTAVPRNRLAYHIAALKHRQKDFDYSVYKRFQGDQSFYFYDDYEVSGLAVRHIVIPYGKQELVSLIYYLEREKNLNTPFQPLYYLAEINARELQTGNASANSWQIFDCADEEKVPVTFKIRQQLTKKEKTVYLKMYSLYESGRGISYTKILTKSDADSVSLQLCPNSYVLEYRSVRDKLLHTDTLHIGF